jgi:hypothetical protein
VSSGEISNKFTAKAFSPVKKDRNNKLSVIISCDKSAEIELLVVKTFLKEKLSKPGIAPFEKSNL